MNNSEKEQKETFESAYDDIYGKPERTEASEDGEQKQDASEITDIEIVGIRFKKNGKIYYFSPAENKYEQNDEVIVETARGLEFGTVMIPNKIITSDKITLPLRNVVRTANDEDKKHHTDNMNKEIDAYNLCVRKIAEHRLTMKLVDVEYTFDNSKLLFYFTAEGRIDFRDLVKDLASIFKTRIELRQIGIRDEAKLIGGLGICGRPFCCHSFLGDFVQVSIKMAKEQSLSLNSTKISGACGRLMCCLRYEYDVYEEEIKKTPKVGTIVVTPDGHGTVIETMPLAGMCRVMPEDNKDQSPKVYHRDDLQPNDGWKPEPREPKENKDNRENKEVKGNTAENSEVFCNAANTEKSVTVEDEAVTVEKAHSNDEIEDGKVSERTGKRERQDRSERQFNRYENGRGNRKSRNNRSERNDETESVESENGNNGGDNAEIAEQESTENKQGFRYRDNRRNYRRNNAEIKRSENAGAGKKENAAENSLSGEDVSEHSEHSERYSRSDRPRNNFRHGQRRNHQNGNRSEGAERSNRQENSESNDKK